LKITNPDWHPQSWSQLTTAQRVTLRRLYHTAAIHFSMSHRLRKSLLSLVRHGLAQQWEQGFSITQQGRQWVGDVTIT
jgi:hypothetical protein